jgi:S-adenosylmethionine:tRNA ribosyltransferase-isomerase
MRLEDFDYHLPPELIAQAPAATRAGSRLLHLDSAVGGACHDRQFADIAGLVQPGDLMVFNDTRVIKARLHGRKASGGKVEILIERLLTANEALAQVSASHSPREGSTLTVADSVTVTVMERKGEFFRLRFEARENIIDLLDAHGEVPLPPYIRPQGDVDDEARYQTVYAREPGAVAAPTAGLHFDQAMLEQLGQRGVRMAYVTLHVGAGTFQPVRVSDLGQHEMHAEWYRIPVETVEAVAAARARGNAVISVGTTTLRALESAAAAGELTAGSADTRLFIMPGYRFRVVDRLITNFHLPKSTLLMLVSAFAGVEPIRAAYRHAVESRYRFFSYGDAMLIERGNQHGQS